MNDLAAALAAPTALPQEPGATLVGRVWLPERAGPALVTVRENGDVADVSALAPTLSHLLRAGSPRDVLSAGGTTVGGVREILENSHHAARSGSLPWLLAPVDLQPIKASGVTFVVSLLERVIEERAGGRPEQALEIREQIVEILGGDLSRIRPGSEEAAALGEHLREIGAWSQYLEVGIGPDAEIFTKCPPMASVGTGAEIGILRSSKWNNPEPELALIVTPAGDPVGVTLANDVNLRDIEGRSALLLGKAKDNNASTAIGPFIRLLDDGFTLDDARSLDIALHVGGEDGFELDGTSSLSLISRDLLDLVGQAIGPEHQYPDGLVLLTGSMFAPTVDRGEEGGGFTHLLGDLVTISSPRLGTLANTVQWCDVTEPWSYGIADLIDHLSGQG